MKGGRNHKGTPVAYQAPQMPHERSYIKADIKLNEPPLMGHLARVLGKSLECPCQRPACAEEETLIRQVWQVFIAFDTSLSNEW